ncbi:MAG: polysaccharide biosynthesis protein [Hyphomicrobiales bacterium]|nr:polysaccharide biosynthesis protein [Hyphomicrobiales bacterium]
MLHDLATTVVALLGSFYLHVEPSALDGRWPLLWYVLPGFVALATVVYALFGLSRPGWRFVSISDLTNIVAAAAVLAALLLLLDYVLVSPNVYGGYFFGKKTIVMYFLLQTALLGGPRLAYRVFHEQGTRTPAGRNVAAATLIMGDVRAAEALLRAYEFESVGGLRVVGILSQSPADQGQSVRGIKVLGSLDEFESVAADLKAKGTTVKHIVFTSSAFLGDSSPETLFAAARRLGIATSRALPLDSSLLFRIAPISPEEMILRPIVSIDATRAERAVRGRAVVVTGGGGSIGAEICRRVVELGGERLIVVENSEPALHAIVEELSSVATGCRIEGHLADIRDRDRMFELFGVFRPGLVFHAAALKHVPILEQDWSEAVKTNVLGSANVADAAVAAEAEAVVMISSDKAVMPVSVLGATKRFAEMYCQALDAEFSAINGKRKPSTRLIAVRFGNVVGSNGSVVPKFSAQIKAGGPVTVTHPDMVRYFMTIREACDLVLSAASHATTEGLGGVSVYVLNMGQPLSIVELANRMIRLSGLEPGRDIEVVFTGIRPGERLHELLFEPDDPQFEIGVAGIVAARPVCPPAATVRDALDATRQALVSDPTRVMGHIRQLVGTTNDDATSAALRLIATDQVSDKADCGGLGVGGLSAR